MLLFSCEESVATIVDFAEGTKVVAFFLGMEAVLSETFGVAF